MTGPDDPHLSQHIEQIEGILRDLTEFLKTAAFDPPENRVEKCTDKGLPKAYHALIKASALGRLPAVIPAWYRLSASLPLIIPAW